MKTHRQAIGGLNTRVDIQNSYFYNQMPPTACSANKTDGSQTFFFFQKYGSL